METTISDGCDHTISGLLRKRAELFNEAERIRDRMAEIWNDIDALDRTLGSFGYMGDLDAVMPRQKRQVMFGTGELTRALMRTIADAGGPMTSRELAQTVISLRGDDARDRRLLSEATPPGVKGLAEAKGRWPRALGSG
ncbi:MULTISPECIES: hypothetical protein [Hansschlegelia]|uniref:hypothetical protein n=1 Tax=Hansschlegelia TaxID=444599 RepID=UPI0019D4E5B4|nr:hypothetical protein [Hansschlegelia zhihuaiae]